MSRLQAVPAKSNEAFIDSTDWAPAVVATNYLCEAGDSITAAATIDITAEFHPVTGTTTIANIVDALGAVAGQQVRLYFASALTVQNNGGGTGNIRTLGGSDRAVAAGEIVVFTFDGTYWRVK